MEELMIASIARFFTDTENPILIFCKWEDACRIQEDIQNKFRSVSFGEFKNPNEKHNLNVFSCMYEGKTLIFIDERQKFQFLELSKK